MVLSELKDKLLCVTFTYDQLVYIIETLEDIAETDKTLDKIMNVFDGVEVLEEEYNH